MVSFNGGSATTEVTLQGAENVIKNIKVEDLEVIVDLSQIEEGAIIKLRHPYRINLMKQYTDETFDKQLIQNFIGEFHSLITKDIVNNITPPYENNDLNDEKQNLNKGFHLPMQIRIIVFNELSKNKIF